MQCTKCLEDVAEVSPEGECFECSTGDSEGMAVTNTNIQDSFKNIAAGLGNKVVRTRSHVLKKMAEAVKDKAS